MKDLLDRSLRAWFRCFLFAILLSLKLSANPVLDWNSLMLDAIRTDNTGPTLSSRNLAILGVAMYDSVNGIQGQHQPYLVTNRAPAGIAAEVAASATAHRVVGALYPSLKARADELLAAFLAAVPESAARQAGIDWGNRVADVHLESRRADGSQTEIPYIPSDAPGQWRRTPPFFRPPLTPHWRRVRPFAMADVAEYRSPPPPPMTSARYARDLALTKEIGSISSTTRTAEQAEIAVFWSDFSYTAMPPGHWNEIAITVARDTGLGVESAARLMALLGLAQADAAIACWETKFHYNTWRPVTAIRRADEDGNSATQNDPTWDSLLISPPFPEYTSGHSTFSGASSSILAHFFGTDAISFTARSDSLPGVFRSFNSLRACADEVGMSRVYGGIHFMFANMEGKRAGRAIADLVSANYFLPVSSLPRVTVEDCLDGQLRLRVHGVFGQRYRVERSPDLGVWQDVAVVETGVGGARVGLDRGLQGGFFRASQVP